ncbi:MAG: lactococcin 972 family bacteriocin [Mobilicoccus sp.]|nr:lactococcin 972 family bacteriocin [Mobilicoccus sp.]
MSTAVATTFALGAAAPAMAAIAYVEGGKWNYGVNSESVWSYYDHDSKKHKSSAVGQIVYPSGCAAAGAPARASGPKARFNNQSYYGFC